jgi:hypothetical protein
MSGDTYAPTPAAYHEELSITVVWCNHGSYIQKLSLILLSDAVSTREDIES